MNGNYDKNTNDSRTADTEKYPDTSKALNDPQLARDAYRAYLGELEAISEYVYQSLMLEEFLPELAKLFESIAIEEMGHFEELGRLVRNLGGNPVINTRVNSGTITQDKDSVCHNRIIAMRKVAQNIEAENAASLTYRKLSERTRDERIRALFLILAEDEERHSKKLTNAYRSLEEK